jgi:hypothetical protein
MRQRGQGKPIRDEDKTAFERRLEWAGRLPGVKQVGGALSGWGKRPISLGPTGQRTFAVGPGGDAEDITGRPAATRSGFAGRLFGAGGKVIAGAAGFAESGASQLNTLANKSAEEAFNKAMRTAKGLRPQDNAVRIKEALIRPTRESSMIALAHYEKMVLDDDPSDIEDLEKSGALSPGHIKKIGIAAKQLRNPNHYRTFLKSQISSIKDFEPSWGDNEINRFIHRFVRMEDISGLNIDWHQYDPTDQEKAKTLERLVLQMARNPLPAMMQAVGDPTARKRIMDHLESKEDNWYIDNLKEDVLRWSTSNAARDQFGLDAIH